MRFRSHTYDQRNSRISIDKVSIITLQGRLKLATRIGDYQRQQWNRGKIKGQSDLIYQKGVFYLVVAQDIPEEKEYEPVGFLGIDLGIENIAVDSNREIFDCKYAVLCGIPITHSYKTRVSCCDDAFY
jgi:putative transposase